jgi:glutaminyl-peptide cyclotransferase
MRIWRAEVVERYPHPGRGFTQGLIAGAGSAPEHAVWESTGLYGQSAICRYRLGRLQPDKRAALPAGLFGEGICRAGAYIWQLTWRERVALRWDARTLELLEQVPYNREGWGICAATDSVFTSDGSGELVRRDPDTLAAKEVIHIRQDGERILGLNDLAWSGGRIWANVAGTRYLAGIDPDTGQVTDAVRATAAAERSSDPQVIMNGVAALPAPNEFLLTGKTWHHVRHVRLVPARERRTDRARLRGGWFA